MFLNTDMFRSPPSPGVVMCLPKSRLSSTTFTIFLSLLRQHLKYPDVNWWQIATMYLQEVLFPNFQHMRAWLPATYPFKVGLPPEWHISVWKAFFGHLFFCHCHNNKEMSTLILLTIYCFLHLSQSQPVAHTVFTEIIGVTGLCTQPHYFTTIFICNYTLLYILYFIYSFSLIKSIKCSS